MNELWYRKLGFYNNPFSIKPAAFHDGLMGYEDLLDDVSYAILNNKVLFVEGDFGKGKTTLLKRILRDFGGKKQVIYFSCNRLDARLDVDRLLRGRYGIWGKLFDLKPKDMILLLDEVQALSKRDCDRIYNYHKRGFFRSVVFVGKKYDKKNFTSEINSALQVFKLGKITEEDAVAIVRRRVGKLPLLPDSMIKKIFKLSNSNPRALLKNCEAVCRYAVEYGEDVVTEDIINEALGSGIISEAPKTEKKFVNKEEIIAASSKAEKTKPIEKKVKVDAQKKKSSKAKPKKAPEKSRAVEEKPKEEKKLSEEAKAEEKPKAEAAPEAPEKAKEEPAEEKADIPEIPEEELDEIDKELEKVKIDEDEETHIGENGASHFDESFAVEDDLEEKELDGEEQYY